MDVAAWLHGLGLGQYEQAFRANDIDAEVLGRPHGRGPGWTWRHLDRPPPQAARGDRRPAGRLRSGDHPFHGGAGRGLRDSPAAPARPSGDRSR